MIFILNKQEKVVNILRNGGGANQAPPFFDDIYSQDLATGAETFSFSTVAINNVARDLVIGNYVAFKNDEGEYKLFQITQTEEYHEDAMYMSVYAEGAGLELINKVFRARKSPSTSLRKFMEMVLDETGWNVGAIPFSAQESIDLDLEDATVYATLQNTLSKYGVEMSFRCEINNGRISTKYVDLHTQRGRVTGKRFAFGRDIEGIRRKVDSTELFTALIGKGNKDINFKDVTVDGINKPLGQDFVADQDAYDRYNNNGYHIIGIFNYDTDSPEELLRETYKQLQKCKEPKIEYEVSVALLGELLGESWNKVSIGDTVAIVDNAFNPPIHLMARVSKLDKSFTNNQSDTCTLANFVEVKSNITDEMRRLASELEGYVDGALDNKFPIGGEDIKEGAINGSHIYKDTITTDHLIADAVTANKIKAESIETKHLQADSIKSQHISAEQIEAEHIKSGTITADKIATGTITAESGIIADATIGTAQIKDAEITVAKIQNAFVDSLVANQGKFQSAHIGVLTSDNIDADTIKAEHIQASVIDAINLNVEGKISADRIDVTDLVVDNIDAGKITTGTLDADRIKASVINAINTSIENATIDSAKIGELSADKISAGVIDAINMSVSGKISANKIDVDSIKVNNIDAEKITSGYLSSDRIEAGSITAEKINSDTISAIELSASEITANKIASGEIKVGDANIIDGTISGAKITKASIGNAQISEAFIADAYIENVTADKIKGGTLDAKEITVKNLNADSITVGQINGRQIAGGAISYDKLDSILSGDIRNTIDNVDQALEDVGLVQETVKKTVKSVDVEYAMNTSSTTAPTTGWQSTPPTWTNGSFIWSRTTTVLTDGTSSTTKPVCVTGAKGETGATGASGKGIKSTAITYQASSSGTTTPTGTWSTTIPSVGAGQYLWTRTVITYTDSSTATSYSIGKMGEKGATGASGNDGKGIKSTVVTYQASTSGTTVPTGSWVSSIPSVSAGQFLWTRTVITYTDDTSSTSYSVGKMGEKGATGATGATGQGVESITEEYYLSTSKTTQTGGSWVTKPPAWSTGKYMWTRSKIVYKNPTSTSYTTPICDSSWEAVNNVEEEVTNIVKIVDGKNSIFYSTSAPSTSGKKENDVWFDTDDGYKMYKFTNGAWVATQFGTNAIVSNAITADKIASSSITAGKIASGAVTTDKLYALAVTADKISANAITAGKIATDAVLANNIKAGAVTTDKVSAKAINADKLDVDNLFVGDNAFIKKLKAVEIDASNITTGTISNDRIDIRGLISFEALDESLKPIFNVQGDKTYINGGLIATNTIKANSIDLLSGLTVKGEDGQNTFSIASNGEVEVNGLLKSGNFDENKNTGYRLSTDGKAILNQAVVKGDVILPSAGMTNYGGQIGNENMALNTTGIRTITGNNSTNQCTTVAKLEANSISGKTVTISYKYKFAKGAIGTFKVQTAGSYWAQVGEILTADGTEKSGKVVGKLTVTVPTDKEINSLQVRMDNFTGTVEISEIKVEKGEVATPWCPHPLEQLNHVRIWAGTNYENRENAKFRVYDNGDIYATDGTFSGKMYGDLDSGLVHIHNNEIVINSISSFMDESGVVRSIAPMDYNPNPYLRLGAGTSILNTDLILGSETDRKIEFLNSNRQFNFNNTSLNLSAPTRTSGANFSFNPNGSYNSAFSVGSVIADTDATLTIGYHNGTWANTSIITHNGSRGGANGDICFKRSNNTEDLNVYVQGNMKVKNSIQSSIQNIEMRSVSNEGWGFYAT